MLNGAWIFLSIGDAGGSQGWVGLDGVIGMADANNHSIPNPDELEEAVSNLVAAGLVLTEGTRMRLTEAGDRVYGEANERPVGHITRMFELGDSWRARDYPKQVPKSWSLDEQTWRQAVDAYLRGS